MFAFDVALNRHAAVCEQRVINKGKLTKIVFHPRQPLILVGDSRGVISSLKVSPNLRKNIANEDAQREKLDRVLEIAHMSAA